MLEHVIFGESLWRNVCNSYAVCSIVVENKLTPLLPHKYSFKQTVAAAAPARYGLSSRRRLSAGARALRGADRGRVAARASSGQALKINAVSAQLFLQDFSPLVFSRPPCPTKTDNGVEAIYAACPLDVISVVHRVFHTFVLAMFMICRLSRVCKAMLPRNPRRISRRSYSKSA